MKRLIILTCSVLLCLTAVGQSFADVLRCKNGSEYIGKIIESNDDYIRIVLSNGMTRIVYKEDLVSVSKVDSDSFVREYTISERARIVQNDMIVREHMNLGKKGYFGEISMRITSCIPLLTGDMLSNSISVINGYRFNKHLATGIGIDINISKGFGIRSGVSLNYPLYLNIRYDILDRKISPYITLDAGFNFCSRDVSYRDVAYQSNIGDVYEERIYYFTTNYNAPMIRPGIGIGLNVGKYRMLLGLESKILMFAKTRITDYLYYNYDSYNGSRANTNTYPYTACSILDFHVGFEF